MILQSGNKLGVDFVAVTVAFQNVFLVAVQLVHDTSPLCEDSLSLAQSHGTPHVCLRPLRHEHNHLVERVGVKFFAVGIDNAKDVAGKFDNSHLKTQADAEVWDFVFTGPPCCLHLAQDTTGTKTTRHKNTLCGAQAAPCVVVFCGVLFQSFLLEHFGLDPLHLDLVVAHQACMLQCLDQREIGVTHTRVLAYDHNLHTVTKLLPPCRHLTPLAQENVCSGITFSCLSKRQALGDDVEHVLFDQKKGHLPNTAAVVHVDHLLWGHVAEHRDLLLDVVTKHLRAAAHNNIRRQPKASQFAHTVLGGFCLLLPRGPNHRHQAHMDQQKVLVSHTELELAHGLNKRCTLNITNSASQLDDADLWLLVVSIGTDLCHPLDPILDLIGDVWHHLDGLAEVVTAALLLNYIPVDLARCDVVVLVQRDVYEPLIVAQIEIYLPSIVKNVAFTVLVR
eukprot:comp8036_c0_seq1/m.3538 comp8036_c0_seq1/g.3538  ORF comp8036_c0_seq1/g.3538 comp8036_c0_seq1/m.3538 type:complete len:449 (+) comp8036_c0_seq1:966-2312(+)